MTLKAKMVRWALRMLSPRLALVCARRSTRIAAHLPLGIAATLHNYYGRYSVEIDTTYPIEREMVTGKYDRDTIRLMEACIVPGDHVMDIGANVGALSLVMASLVSHTGRVFAIEPGPLTYGRLVKTVARNQLHWVAPFAIGLGKSAGQLGWQLDRSNLGNACLVAEGYDCLVPVETLDEFVRSQSIARLDFIKMDVEGMEYEIFLGAETTLLTLRPTVYFETVEARRQQQTAIADLYMDLERRLRDKDYLLCRHLGDGVCARTDLAHADSNTLAVHREKMPAGPRFRIVHD